MRPKPVRQDEGLSGTRITHFSGIILPTLMCFKQLLKPTPSPYRKYNVRFFRSSTFHYFDAHILRTCRECSNTEFKSELQWRVTWFRKHKKKTVFFCMFTV